METQGVEPRFIQKQIILFYQLNYIPNLVNNLPFTDFKDGEIYKNIIVFGDVSLDIYARNQISLLY